MRLWLFRRASDSAPADAGPVSDKTMGFGSLEHVMRNRVRWFFRRTWLVAVLAALLVAGTAWAAFYYSTQSDHMRIAAGPIDSKFVDVLSDQIKRSHKDFTLKLVATADTQATVDAISIPNTLIPMPA